MSKILKNNTGSDVPIVDVGNIVVPASGQLVIALEDYLKFRESTDTVSKLLDGTLTFNDGTKDWDNNNAINILRDYHQIFHETSDRRQLIAPNRIPSGYSLYVAGECDDMTSGAYGGGDPMLFDSTNPTRDFRQLNHYYAIGVRAKWHNCNFDNYMTAILKAPASQGLTNQSGDYTKYNIGGPYNMIIPVAIGTGDWDMDISAFQANGKVLKATPVPQAGNTGWFDYDSSTNTLTRNMTQTGGYNLYDFDVNLHAFGRKCWASPSGETALDITDLVGKLLYNCWVLSFEFGKNTGSLSSEQASVSFITGAMGNV